MRLGSICVAHFHYILSRKATKILRGKCGFHAESHVLKCTKTNNKIVPSYGLKQARRQVKTLQSPLASADDSTSARLECLCRTHR